MWKGDLKPEEFSVITQGQLNTKFHIKTGLFLTLNIDQNALPSLNTFRPHHLVENGSCRPIVIDWTERLLIMNVAGESQIVVVHHHNLQSFHQLIQFDEPVASACVTDQYIFVGLQSGLLEVVQYRIEGNLFTPSHLNSHTICGNELLDEVVYLQTFQKDSRLLTVTKKGISKIWKINFPIQQPEATFFHSHALDEEVHFAKILGDTYLLTADLTGRCKVMNVKTNECFLLEHTAPVQGCTRFMNILFVAYNDQKIILWNLDNGKKLTTYDFDFSILDIFFTNNCLSIIGTNSEATLVNCHFDFHECRIKAHLDQNFIPIASL
jgi:WD40 repeat protein